MGYIQNLIGTHLEGIRDQTFTFMFGYSRNNQHTPDGWQNFSPLSIGISWTARPVLYVINFNMILLECVYMYTIFILYQIRLAALRCFVCTEARQT